jgi:hypothetical protein
MILGIKSARVLASSVLAIAMAIGGATTLSADQNVGNVTLSPGGTFCLAPELTSSFTTFNASGFAFDFNLQPVAVKWSVWHGPSPYNITTRLFRVTDSQFGYSAPVTGDWEQACINNTSAVTVVFFMRHVLQ